jgi:hypothetical protein
VWVQIAAAFLFSFRFSIEEAAEAAPQGETSPTKKSISPPDNLYAAAMRSIPP